MAASHQLFLSDLHLERADDARFATFSRILRSNASANLDIYILGDLCEVWVGDDDDADLARALRAELRRASNHSRVHLMHGNRDFLFGPRFATDTGVQLLQDPHIVNDNLLLSHGDAYCTDDAEYQTLRRTLRDAGWQASILEQSLEARRQLAAGMRAQSRATNANKAQNIMDVNADAIASALRSHGCEQLIHGHTHRPGRHRHGDASRWVLGDWDHCAWLAVRASESGAIRLLRLPLVDRCENDSVYRVV